jgi:hypothetical protein
MYMESCDKKIGERIYSHIHIYNEHNLTKIRMEEIVTRRLA